MSEATHWRARVAALSRPGANRAALHAARRELAAVNIRRAVDKQRAALGLPPVADDMAAVLTVAAFAGKAALWAPGPGRRNRGYHPGCSASWPS